MARMRKPSPQTLSVLVTLIGSAREWRHGYELSQKTGLKSGTLYPILMRLEDQGVLESDWRESEQPGRPPRHVYRLTPDGVALVHSLEAGADARAGRPKAALG